MTVKAMPFNERIIPFQTETDVVARMPAWGQVQTWARQDPLPTKPCYVAARPWCAQHIAERDGDTETANELGKQQAAVMAKYGL